MSRVIKFRAWDKAYNAMCTTPNGFENLTGWLQSPEVFTVMQFTGLHDKNGVEIYEGDIVRYNTGEEWSVKWSSMYSRVILADNRKGYNLNQDLGMHEVEVIGNVYEDRCLLTRAA